MQLTKEQEDAIIRLGSSSCHEIVQEPILEQLIALGVVAIRPSDRRLDFTNEGENVLAALRRMRR